MHWRSPKAALTPIWCGIRTRIGLVAGNPATARSIGPRRVARVLAGWAVAVISARDPRIAALVVFYGFIPHNDRAHTGPLPPLLVLHGNADTDVPLQSGEDLKRMARQSGGRAELVVYPGEKHRYATWQEQSATGALNRTIAFFRAGLIGH
jgi:carboxymethylenebutenolidase